MAFRGAKLGGVALLTVALTGIASAADLRPPVRSRAYVPVSTWTGCYLGGYVGGAWSENDATFTDSGNALFAAYSGGITAPRREDGMSASTAAFWAAVLSAATGNRSARRLCSGSRAKAAI